MADSPDPELENEVSETAEAVVAFKFCRNCSNLLYPKEDRVNSQLVFACRSCDWSDIGTESCVWRNRLVIEDTATAGFTQDIGSDPTVSSEILAACYEEGFCLTCGALLVGQRQSEDAQVKDNRRSLDISMMDSWDADEMFDDEEEEEHTSRESPSSPQKQDQKSKSS